MKIFGIGIGFQFGRFIGGLPRCIRDITVAWWKDFNTFITIDSTSYVEDSIGTRTSDVYYGQYLAGGTVSGLLNFDGIDDYVELSAVPDVTGTKTINFKLFLPETPNWGAQPTYHVVVNFYDTGQNTDHFCLYYSDVAGVGKYLNFQPSLTFGNSIQIPYADVSNQELDITVTKTTGTITSISINGSIVTGETGQVVVNQVNSNGIIGNGGTLGADYSEALIWDIEVEGVFNSPGRPDGNTNNAWDDTIGVITATVNGSPTTIDLSTASGQINLYRTSGTYDYTDPTDGSAVTGTSIPASGLITIPANGICEIITSDGSRYPVCERAGTVLHDVLENSIHISVATPSWSEELYGSDYLNQCSFVDKEQSDYMGYDWETVVDGSPVTLDDNTLIPISSSEYIENTLDGGMDLIL